MGGAHFEVGVAFRGGGGGGEDVGEVVRGGGGSVAVGGVGGRRRGLGVGVAAGGRGERRRRVVQVQSGVGVFFRRGAELLYLVGVAIVLY